MERCVRPGNPRGAIPSAVAVMSQAIDGMT
jgi:hypothetical protein